MKVNSDPWWIPPRENCVRPITWRRCFITESSMNKRILLIVEGPKDEKVILEKLWDRFDKKTDYTIVPYETNIYFLTRQLFRDGEMDEDVDLLRIFKSVDVPENKRLGKEERFTDIYLIFDFDPHDTMADFGILRKMLAFFNDSSTGGKLFINYPMMQSYRHILS